MELIFYCNYWLCDVCFLVAFLLRSYSYLSRLLSFLIVIPHRNSPPILCHHALSFGFLWSIFPAVISAALGLSSINLPHTFTSSRITTHHLWVMHIFVDLHPMADGLWTMRICHAFVHSPIGLAVLECMLMRILDETAVICCHK